MSKEARVTEEIGLHRESQERTETVSDSVRRTEVEVEDERDLALGTRSVAGAPDHERDVHGASSTRAKRTGGRGSPFALELRLKRLTPVA